MTKLEKLKNELIKCDSEISKFNKKKAELENKIKLEEQSEISKMLKEKNLSFDDLKQLLNK